VRIYPAKNCDIYDQYFSGMRPLNKLVYRMLYSDDILKREGLGSCKLYL